MRTFVNKKYHSLQLLVAFSRVFFPGTPPYLLWPHLNKVTGTVVPPLMAFEPLLELLYKEL